MLDDFDDKLVGELKNGKDHDETSAPSSSPVYSSRMTFAVIETWASQSDTVVCRRIRCLARNC